MAIFGYYFTILLLKVRGAERRTTFVQNSSYSRAQSSSVAGETPRVARRGGARRRGERRHGERRRGERWRTDHSSCRRAPRQRRVRWTEDGSSSNGSTTDGIGALTHRRSLARPRPPAAAPQPWGPKKVQAVAFALMGAAFFFTGLFAALMPNGSTKEQAGTTCAAVMLSRLGRVLDTFSLLSSFLLFPRPGTPAGCGGARRAGGRWRPKKKSCARACVARASADPP